MAKPDFRRRKTKGGGIIFVRKQKLSHTEIFTSQKSVKLVAKSSLIQSKQTFGSISSKYIYGSEGLLNNFISDFLSDKLNLFFFFRFHLLFLRCLIEECSLFQIPSDTCFAMSVCFKTALGSCGWIFLDVNLVVFLQPKVASLLLETLKYEDSGFHHMHTLFVRSTPDFHIVSFWR